MPGGYSGGGDPAACQAPGLLPRPPRGLADGWGGDVGLDAPGRSVPGIPRICGDLASSQASTICRGLAPCRLAASVTAGLLPACWIGAQGRNAICSSSHLSTIDSDVRSATLYLFCTETTGVICCAARNRPPTHRRPRCAGPCPRP